MNHGIDLLIVLMTRDLKRVIRNKHMLLYVLSKLGNDIFGENYSKNLRDLGVDTRYVNVVDDSTGMAQITVSDNGKYTHNMHKS